MTTFQYWFLIAVIVTCAALIGDEIRKGIECLKDIELNTAGDADED